MEYQSSSSQPKDECGSTFGNKMLTMSYQASKGWSSPIIKDYAPITISPSAQCLHYGQTVFEDMVAYHINDDIHIFKPFEHFEKFNQSLNRIEMPAINKSELLLGIEHLINQERQLFDLHEHHPVNIRTVMFASENKLGVSKSDTYELITFLSPLPKKLNCQTPELIKAHVEDEYVKSVTGGAGFTQFGGNYAASYAAKSKAAQFGYDHVIWLDGREITYIEELNNMNIFFVINHTLITPALDGITVPGVTRQSVIDLAKELGYQIEERQISIEEVLQSYKDGLLTEVFSTSTINAITPVSEIKYKDNILTIHNNKIGPITQHLITTYTFIQQRKLPDMHQWNYTIEREPIEI